MHPAFPEGRVFFYAFFPNLDEAICAYPHFMKQFLFILICCGNTLAAQNFNWAATHSPGNASSYSTVKGISSDPAGNVYVTGGLSGTVDFDPGTGIQNFSSTGSGMYMQKLDPAGQLLWTNAFTGSGSILAQKIKYHSNHVYAIGSYFQTVDFDPGPGNTSINASRYADAYICKYTTSGNLLWAKTLGDSAAVTANDVFCDASGNVISGGHFYERGDFDPGPSTYYLTPAAYAEVYISKLDSNGNFVWAKTFPGMGSELLEAMDMDANGNIYLCVSFGASFDADPGLASAMMNTTSPTGATAIIKLDPNGNFLWAEQFGEGTTGYMYCYSITASASGATAVAGFYKGDADFDPSAATAMHTSNGISDGFVLKLQPNGTLDFVNFYGLPNTSNVVMNCRFDAGGSLYASGYYSDSVRAGNQLYTTDTTGIFLMKLDVAGQIAWQGNMPGLSVCNVNPGATHLPGSGEWYIGGNTVGQLDADPGSNTFPLTTTSISGFIVKLSGTFSVPENDPKDNLLIYPNPSDGLVTFEFKNTLPVTDVIINVRDVSGRVVLSAAGQTGSSAQLDLRSFASGFYTVEITGGSIKHVTKLIKQ